MTYTNQLLQLKTILETVTDIGVVHDSIRWSRESQEFIKIFTTQINSQGQIRTWMVSRVSGADAYGMLQSASLGTQIRVPVGQQLRKYDWEIQGFMSFTDDETESEFQALAESVLAKFNDNISLNSSCLERGFISYKLDHVFLGDHLVHHMELTFWTAEIEGINPT